MNTARNERASAVDRVANDASDGTARDRADDTAEDTALITALDFADPADVRAFAARLEPALTRVKIGNEAFTVGGPALVDELQGMGFDVFLDLKYHDIPNTVAAAVRRAAGLGVWMVNIHASGGRRMLEAAREAIAAYGDTARGAPVPGTIGASGTVAGARGTRLIGVTVLTSLEREDLAEVGLDVEPETLVRRLATLARDAGLDGVVCSPHEIALVRALAAPPFLTVTPGVRPWIDGAAPDDQRRTMTPCEAILAGADHLVVGRPVTRAADPLAALQALVDEIDDARAVRRTGAKAAESMTTATGDGKDDG